MYKMTWFLFFVLAASSHAAAETNLNRATKAVWRETFDAMPAGWEVRTKPGVKAAKFSIAHSADKKESYLEMKADDASASLLVELKKIDLTKTPILRWRWRVTVFPTGADGRVPKKDDQAIGIYISTGGFLRQRSLAYRWETDTPVGAEGKAKYAAGIVTVKWICLRNKKDARGKAFITEERNLAKDYKKAFGYVPTEFGIGISCNSQYTESKAEAQLDWIELAPE